MVEQFFNEELLGKFLSCLCMKNHRIYIAESGKTKIDGFENIFQTNDSTALKKGDRKICFQGRIFYDGSEELILRKSHFMEQTTLKMAVKDIFPNRKVVLITADEEVMGLAPILKSKYEMQKFSKVLHSFYFSLPMGEEKDDASKNMANMENLAIWLYESTK